jgi:hypothetical protein
MISSTFTTGAFAVIGAEYRSDAVVRVLYSADPRQSNPAGATDGLNPTKYALSGPAVATVASVSIVGGDPQALDLLLTAPLPAGTWTVTVSGVQTPSALSLSINSASFVVSEQANLTSLTAGAEEETADQVIRKHLSPALAGPNWDALIEALSQGDTINWDNARAAFDQLFKSSASGNYLDRLASNDGLLRPKDLGLSDELFRQLSIRLTNEKLTHNALRRILEVFYGRDALSAWVETSNESPYALTDGDTLDLLLDEQTTVPVTFRSEQFTTISRATATEVAAVITKTLLDARVNEGVALSFVDTVTGGSKVKIYSPSLGLKSFVRITGGTAQPALRFSTHKEVYASDVSGSGYSWVFSAPTQNVTRMVLTTVGIPLINVTDLEPGDYVVVGPTANPVPAGTYTISLVSYQWSGPNFIQTIELDAVLGVTGSQAQLSNLAYTFFAPTKKTTLNGDRTVVVAQSSRGKIDVQFPATTQAVGREPGLAAYGQEGTALEIKRYVRDGNGVLTVELETPATLAVGSSVWISGLKSIRTDPWVSAGTPGTHPTVAISDGSFGTTWSASQVPPDPVNEYTEGVVLANGDLMLIGGLRGGTSRTSCNRFRLVGTATVTDGSEAAGAVRRTYQWISTASLVGERTGHAATRLLDNRVLVTGGNSISRFGANGQVATAELYAPGGNTWSALPSMLLADAGGNGKRQNHTQTALSNGKVLVTGGSWNDGTATQRTHLFDTYSLTWNPYSFTSRLAEYRTNHQAISLADGRVFLIGGQTLGRTNEVSNILAYWAMDDASGATITDLGGGFNMTLTGSAPIIDGKVNRARDFGGLGTATAAGSGPATTALLGSWTVDFWILPPYGDGVVVAYGGTTETLADNTLMEVGVNATGQVFWRWENGVLGDDVGATQSNSPFVTAFSGKGCHVAVRKTTGATSTVDVFLNGFLAQTWTGQTNPSGGTAGAWYLNRAPEGGNGYRAAIDEVRVSTVALSNEAIVKAYLRTKGWVSTGPFASSETLNSTEFYDPATATCSPGPQMVWSRAFHKALKLSDGRILVVGGTGYRRDRPFPPFNTSFPDQWPNNGIAEFEIWDPKTNKWSVAGILGRRWVDPNIVQIGSKVWISGPSVPSSVSYESGTSTSEGGLEILDLATMKSTSHFVGYDAARDRGFAVGDIGLFVGGNASGTSHTTADLLIPGADTIGAAGINDKLHTVLSSSAGTFTVKTPEYKQFCSNFGDITKTGGLTWSSTTDSYAAAATSNSYPISLAARTTNVTTVTVPSTAGLVAGQRVFVNFAGNVGISAGLKTISSVTATTVLWADPGANVASGPVNGAISVDLNSTASVLAATAASSTIKGPYLYDEGGVAVTGIATTTTVAVPKGVRTATLSVASTTGFPDSGYLVLAFGTSAQSKPIRLIQKLNSTSLLVDFGFLPESTYAVGTSVEYLVDRNGFVVDGDAMFYVTASAAGRVAAQVTTQSATAAGIDVDFTVKYPGDRGLGGEGYPTEATDSEPKVSDVTKIWGE